MHLKFIVWFFFRGNIGVKIIFSSNVLLILFHDGKNGSDVGEGKRILHAEFFV